MRQDFAEAIGSQIAPEGFMRASVDVGGIPALGAMKDLPFGRGLRVIDLANDLNCGKVVFHAAGEQSGTVFRID